MPVVVTVRRRVAIAGAGGCSACPMFIVVSTKPPVTMMVRLVVVGSTGRIVAEWNCVGGAVVSVTAVSLTMFWRRAR